MHKLICLALAFSSLSLAFPVLAQANFLQENPDCAFFQNPDLNGAYWTSIIDSKDPISAELTPWWQDQASSVWIKDGFVLEAYSEPHFAGVLNSLSAELSEATVPFEGGSYINLETLGFDEQMSSYRCRRQGTLQAFESGTVLWMDAAEYRWTGGGNHPDHKSLLFGRQITDHAIYVKTDSTYGLYTEEYHLNLTRGILKVTLVTPGTNTRLEIDINKALASPEAKKTLSQLNEHIKTIAAGTPNSYYLEAPKPELQSLIAYLESLSL